MVRYNTFANAGRVSWGRYGILYTYRRQFAYAGAGLTLFYAANLEKTPVSGRYRFMIVPEWLEMKIGQSSYRQIMSQFSGSILPDNSRQTKRVKRVMNDIIKVSGLPADLDWQIHVIGGMQYPPNAFVLPGGKVFVFESILPICGDNNGLATVLSHECAHQVCRHTAEQLSRAPLRIAGMIALYAITGYSRLDNFLLRIAFDLPCSRVNETEADDVGLVMMAKACYDPVAAVKFWQRMLQMENRQGGHVPELLSTHPASERRIQDIASHIPKAEEIRSETCSNATQFWEFKKW